MRHCSDAVDAAAAVRSSTEGRQQACCGNGICDGTEMGSSCPQDCVADSLSLEQTQIGTEADSFTSKALLKWRPNRGTEGVRGCLVCGVSAPGVVTDGVYQWRVDK